MPKQEYNPHISFMNSLVKKQDKFKQLLTTLKIGDIIYEEQSRFIDYDYHPQTIRKIDIDNCKILTYEESINVEKWIESFHIYNKETWKFEFCSK